MSSLIENSLQPAAVYNRKRVRFTDCNLKIANLFGYDTCEEWLNLSLLDYFHEEQFNGKTPIQTLAAIFNHFEKNDVHFTSIVGVKKDGTKFILELFAIKNYLNYGAGSVFFFKEIDQQYLTTKIALDGNLIYQTLVNSSFDFIDINSIKILDPVNFKYDVQILDRNENMKKVLGITNEPLIDLQQIAEFTPLSFLKENRHVYKSAILELRKKGTVSFDWQFVRKDEKIIYLSIGLYTVRFADKMIMVRIMRDVTENIIKELLIKEQNETLIKKNNELENYIESNVQLQNFAHIASHDMKAPLRTINSFSQILLKKIAHKLDDKELELFKYIIDGSNNLTVLIDDLLNFSKISSRKLKITTIKPAKILGDLKIELTTLIEESNTEIIINNLPETIEGDILKLKRVFQNIIQNGIKFSKKINKPIIRISSTEDEKFWHFSISDNGIGIEEKNLKSVFEMFRKLNGQRYAGTGMGLALSKNIIEQHKGEIFVQSVFGEGATFHFSIKKNIQIL